MPEWLTIVIAVLGLIGTVLGVFGVSTYISERMKYKAEKKNKNEDREKEKADKMVHEEYVTELKSIIKEALLPINNKLNDMEHDFALVKNGLQKDLYVDLVNIYKELCKKGYATLEEKRDFDALYCSYHNLGKNGIADGMHQQVMSMAETPKPKARKTTAKKKQRLVENH